MLTVVQEGLEAIETGGSLLDEIVRDGARQMLAAALRAEVAAYVDAHADLVDEQGHRLVVRNGFHEPREVTTAAGAVPGPGAGGQRQAGRLSERGAAPVRLGDLAGVVA
jgi:putative transposase